MNGPNVAPIDYFFVLMFETFSSWEALLIVMKTCVRPLSESHSAGFWSEATDFLENR